MCINKKKNFIFLLLLFVSGISVAATNVNSGIDLLNQYYTLQKSDPVQAKKALTALVKQNPAHVTALLEMGYLLIKEKKNSEAIPYFQTAAKLDPTNQQTKRQLAYLLAEKNKPSATVIATISTPTNNNNNLLNQYYALKKADPAQAKKILTTLIKQNPAQVVAQLEMGYLLIQEKKSSEAIPYFQTAAKLDPKNQQTKRQLAYLLAEKNKADNKTTKTTSPLLDQFYAVKEKNPKKAEEILKKLLEQNPCDLTANKEMGYFLIKQKRSREAIPYFHVVEKLDPSNDEIKLQLAYLLNENERNREAYYKFKEVAKSSDCKIHLKGEEGMVNLAGQQTKILKPPFFVDFYSAPYYLSRFKDYIFIAQPRAGINYGKNNQGELYTTIRYYRDTQSSINNAIPAIFADNAIVYSLGTSYQPFEKIPVRGYIEWGRAYELVTNGYGRRWKPDFRVGLTGYTAFGAAPAYSECLSFPGKFVGDLYGDVSYYSRYVHDIIGQIRVRPGIRAATYHNSSLDLYLNINTLFDSQRLFYNNILEVGPGIAFIPDNRLNFAIRAQGILGYYLPINSSQPNPYPSIYRTTTVTLEAYLRF